jgi:hypothetical protein
MNDTAWSSGYVHHLPAVCFCNTLVRYRAVARAR